MVVLVDSFLSEDRTEPLERLLYQLIGSSFGAQTRGEMAHALRISGFRAIRTRNLCKNVWLITGRKTKTQVHKG
jgi:hypothetical protein